MTETVPWVPEPQNLNESGSGTHDTETGALSHCKGSSLKNSLGR